MHDLNVRVAFLIDALLVVREVDRELIAASALVELSLSFVPFFV